MFEKGVFVIVCVIVVLVSVLISIKYIKRRKYRKIQDNPFDSIYTNKIFLRIKKESEIAGKNNTSFIKEADLFSIIKAGADTLYKDKKFFEGANCDERPER